VQCKSILSKQLHCRLDKAWTNQQNQSVLDYRPAVENHTGHNTWTHSNVLLRTHPGRNGNHMMEDLRCNLDLCLFPMRHMLADIWLMLFLRSNGTPLLDMENTGLDHRTQYTSGIHNTHLHKSWHLWINISKSCEY